VRAVSAKVAIVVERFEFHGAEKMKTEGTYEIRAAGPDGRPVSRMRIEYLCESCGYRRVMSLGQAPHRSVSIELGSDGFLLSVE
jgi:hypothetical protein